MGDIRNATAQKFGIWVRKTTGEYDFTKKYGQTADEAFAVIRSEICKLVDAGARDDFNEIRRNMIAPIVRLTYWLCITQTDSLRYIQNAT